jgi:hypothetical protein
MDTKLFVDFWYHFDLFFNPTFGRVPNEILQIYNNILSLPVLWLSDRSLNDGENYPTNFRDRIKYTKEIVEIL